MQTRIVDGRKRQTFPLPGEYRHVEFTLKCDAEEVYLLIGGEDCGAKAFHRMERVRGNRWSITLGLRPGSYRYRYYAFDGQLTTFVVPDEDRNTAERIHHFDARLVVPAKRHFAGAPTSHRGFFGDPDERSVL